MTQYILNYCGGTKGDFLCNFINANTIQFENTNNKSNSEYNFFKKLLHKDFDEINAVEFLKNNSEVKIFPAHFADKIPKDFLIEHNIRLIHLVADKQYFQTIFLEALFKNITNEFKNSNIKSEWDQKLIENNMLVDDKHRILLMKKILDNPKDSIQKKALITLRLKKYQTDDDIILDYKKLYIDKNFTELTELFDIDVDLLSIAIEKTWLPNEIYHFGQVFYPKLYGYRKEESQ